MPRYFAYGSNMSSARLIARVGDVRILGRARLDAHRHAFSKLGRDGTGKGNVEPAAQAAVWGVVYELRDRQLARLGEFELGYREVGLEVALDGGPVTTVSYQALRIVPELAPTPDYLQHYRAGMHEHDLPADYREQVLAELRHLLG